MKKQLIKFDVVDKYSEKNSKNQYLSLFHPNEKHERMFDIIKYLISTKSSISEVYYHNYMKIRIKSNDDDLPLAKALHV